MNANLLEYSDNDIEQEINDMCDPINIGNLMYSPGHVLRLVDPIAFNCLENELPERWECDECRKIHDNEDDANECCKE